MRTLVTGGAGFIGSNLVDHLVGEGADVVVLDDLSTGYQEYVNPAAELVEGDIADPEAVAPRSPAARWSSTKRPIVRCSAASSTP